MNIMNLFRTSRYSKPSRTVAPLKIFLGTEEERTNAEGLEIPEKWPLRKCRSATQNESDKPPVSWKIIFIPDMNGIKSGGKDDQVHRLHKQQNRSELFSPEDVIYQAQV